MKNELKAIILTDQFIFETGIDFDIFYLIASKNLQNA